MLQAKKLLSVALGLALVAAQANAAPKDGVYKEKVMGLIAPFTVEVTLEGGKIVKVTSNDALESPGVGAEAIKTLGDRIVREQTAGVDGVSGASLTSFALLQGTRQALKKAGADESFFKRVHEPAVLPDTVTSDVVVVGGGGAGLAAAVSALEAGATVTIVEKLSSAMTMSEALLVTSVPEPMAMPMSAARMLGASLMPSPVMATTSPAFCKRLTISDLCFGLTRANTRPSGMRASSSLSLIPSSSAPVITSSARSAIPSRSAIAYAVSP